jgi:N-acetylmuramoyl-L-alanine amidase
MADDPQAPRRPFGDRDSDERQRPFGAPSGARRSRTDLPAPESAGDSDNGSSVEDEAPLDLPAWTVAPEDADAPAAESIEPLDEDEPAVEDERDDAPPLVAVRSRRGRGTPERSRLKKTHVPPEPEFQSYPQSEIEAAAEKTAQAVAEQRRQVFIRFGVVARSVGMMLGAAAIIATLLTWWTPNTFLPDESVDQLSLALATQASQEILVTFVPTLTPFGPGAGGLQPVGPDGTMHNIGIVSGHRGIHPASGLPDTGAVCADGLTEQARSRKRPIDRRSAARLWLPVDLFDEFDPRLQGYRALAMIFIHADSCEYINDLATGFKVASFVSSQTPEEDARLVGCLINRYGDTTGLPFHPNTVTRDMTEYHTFAEIDPMTPGAIIEIGFLYLDRDLLAGHPDVVALGIGRGILCYLRGEPVSGQTATPAATTTLHRILQQRTLAQRRNMSRRDASCR